MEPNEKQNQDPFSNLSQSGQEENQGGTPENDPFAQLSQHFEDDVDSNTPTTEEQNQDPFAALSADTDPLASTTGQSLPPPNNQNTESNTPPKQEAQDVTDPFAALSADISGTEDQPSLSIPNPFGSQTTGQSSNPIAQPTDSSSQSIPPQQNQADFKENQEYAKLLLNASHIDNKSEALKDILEEEKSSISQLSEELFANENRNKVTDENVRTEVHDKLIYLTAKLNQDIRFYEKKSGTTRGWSLIFRLLSTALAAVVTVLLGINVSGWLADQTLFFGLGVPWLLNTLALTISAFLTVISDIRSFTDSDALRVKYTDTMHKLKQLRDVIEYLQLGGDYINLKEVNSIKLEYDMIIEETNSYVVESALESENASSRLNFRK